MDRDLEKGRGVSRLFAALAGPYRARTRRGEGAVLDVAAFSAAFLFSGTPVLFGVRPLALSLLSAVSGHALAAYVGAALGCLLQGSAGLVYFFLYTLTFALRLAVSYPGGRRHFPQSRAVFSELLQLRVAAASVGGLALAVYEVCVAGVKGYTLLFAAGAVVLPPVFAFLFCGAFAPAFSLHEFLFGDGVERVLGRASLLWAQAGALSLLFAASLSLAPYGFFGISASALFASAAALLAARRFGALQGAATGFVVSLPIGAVLAPAYGFAGFFAGLLRKKGAFLPMAAAVAAGSAWCAYVGGLSGFLGNMPELAVTALVVWPLSFRVPAARPAQTAPGGEAEPPPPPDGRLSSAFSALSQLFAREQTPHGRETSAALGLFSRFLGDADEREAAERQEDEGLAAELHAALSEIGVSAEHVSVRGARVRRLTARGLRWSGRALPSSEVHAAFERLCGCALSEPGLEMDGGAVTLRMQTVRRFAALSAIAAAGRQGGEASGDTAVTFETREDRFFALLCDGMGSGEGARRVSGRSAAVLRELLSAGNGQEPSLALLNALLRGEAEECSTTVDLLELDLLYGRATFVKSGAAASYVKRGENLFRIRSETSPIGILRTLDAERVRFGVRPGDVIVLLSDGISQTAEDAPWLLEYLSSPWQGDLAACASHILELAGAHGGEDDKTVVLIAVQPSPAQADPALAS